MLARITDVITDPLIGYLSDRTKSKFGRRKPWMAVGAIVMMTAAFLLFNPKEGVTNSYLLIWSMLLWLGWTMINIPYYAWGAELSENYDERTRITGWRQVFAYAGNVTVLALPAIANELTGFGGLPKEGLTIIGSLALIALPSTVAICLLFIPERNNYGSSTASLTTNFKAVWKNGSFKLVWIAFMYPRCRMLRGLAHLFSYIHKCAEALFARRIEFCMLFDTFLSSPRMDFIPEHRQLCSHVIEPSRAT